MRKIFISSILAILALCFNTVAAELKCELQSDFIPADGKIITFVKLNAGFGNENAFYKTSVAVTDNSGSGSEKIKLLKQTRLDGEGKLSFSMSVVPGGGNFSVTVTPEGTASPLSKVVEFTDYSGDSAILNGMFLKELDGEKLCAVLNSENIRLCVDRGVYNTLSQEKKKDFSDEFIGMISEFTLAEYITSFEQLSVKYGINGNSDAVKCILEKLCKYTTVENSKYYSVYSELGNKEAVYELMASLNTENSESFYNAFEEAVRVAALKDVSNKSEIKSVLEKCELYDVSDAAYLRYRSTADLYIYNNKASVTSTEAVKQLVEKAVEYAKASENRPAGGGGGGGGGASSVKAGGDAVMNPEYDEEFAETDKFTDVSRAHWAYKAIDMLAEKGIISGRENGKFYPDDKITRAEFVKIIAGAFEVESEKKENPFDDVNGNEWYFTYVVNAYHSGIVKGAEGKFNPLSEITRQDAFVILSRVLGVKEGADTVFADSPEISGYAVLHINALCSADIISGYEDNTLKPLASITRAEAAKLVSEAMKYKKEG